MAVDTSGFGHDGAIGSHITMNGSFADGDRHPPDAGISYGARHLIMVDDAADGSLDPGSGSFSVEIRYRSTGTSDNTKPWMIGARSTATTSPATRLTRG